MSLSFRRTPKFLWDDSNGTAAGTGNWIDLDTGFVNQYNALYSVSLESGDWVTVQIRLEKDNASAPVFTQQIVSAAGATLVPLDAPARQIRAVKTGTAGKARVILYG